MQRSPEKLSSICFDLAVIGGGVNGAATAREAAFRGLKVALVESRDFASGTSSRSSKLIHGGLRYLEQMDFRLVHEARRERRLLLKLAPHLVRPIPFLLPIYDDDPYFPLKVRLGLTIYDIFGNAGRGDRHRMVSRGEVCNVLPALRPDGIRAGAIYFDAETDDSRLTLEYALDAADHGAVVSNYTEIRAFTVSEGKVVSAEAQDVLTGRRHEITARVWVNATGPWVDSVRAMLPRFDGSKTVRLTKGTHLIVPPISSTHALLSTIRPGKRIFIMAPWQDVALLGTTETDFEGDPAGIQPTREDVDYLLAAVNRVLRKPLVPSDVLGSFSGLRALVLQPGRTSSRTTREFRFHRDAWATNFISVCGGKLTTARALGEKLCDELEPVLASGKAGARLTRTSPLPGGHTGEFKVFAANAARDAAAEFNIPSAVAERIVRTYGSRWQKVLEPIREDRGRARLLPGNPPLLEAEVDFAIRHEMAINGEDFLLRRAGLSWRACSALSESLPAVARIFARHFNTSEEPFHSASSSFAKCSAAHWPDPTS
jgi:glycerol-3-phosphate dehydrogenase